MPRAPSPPRRDLLESPDRLAEFCRGAEGAACVRLEARHVVAGVDSGATVSVWEIEEGGHFNAQEIYSKLVDDADGVGGLQKYLLQAYRAANKSPRDRLLVAVQGDDAGASAVEPSNTQQAALALVIQSQKHVEAMMRGTLSSIASLVDVVTRQNAMLAAQVEKATEEKAQIWEVVDAVHAIDRDKITLEAETRRAEKQSELVSDGLKLLLPGIIAKVAPSQVVRDAAFDRLMGSFTPEQLSAIFPLLTTEQRVALDAMLAKGIAREEASASPKNGAVSP